MSVTLTARSAKKSAKIFFVANTQPRHVFEEGKEILEVPVPKTKTITRRQLIYTIRKATRLIQQYKLPVVTINFSDRFLKKYAGGAKNGELRQLLVENILLALYDFTEFKTGKDKTYSNTVVLDGLPKEEVRKVIQNAQIISEHINECRRLCNTPGSDMNPEMLANSAKKALRGTKATVQVLGKPQIKKENMGLILGVSKGSNEDPRFIVIEYNGGNKNNKLIILIGKGVTFDTGGINLKPSDAIFDMYMDMSGGAAVIQTLALVAKQKLKKNIVGIVPAVENMPSGGALRPGDILRSRSGKTVEIANTDAEGRLILADAIDYAGKYSPKIIIDVATLTGASLVALGEHAHGLLTNSDSLSKQLVRAGEAVGDPIWPLPLFDEFDEHIKGNFADLTNLPLRWNQRYAGASLGGAFLKAFVPKGCAFAHIDMAPRMIAGAHEQLAKGSLGAPVRLLYKYLQHAS